MAASEAGHLGREFLLAAVLRRMAPLDALDTRLFFVINGVTHPRLLDAVAEAVAVVANGGWIWLIGTSVAYLRRVPGSGRALRELAPGLIGVTVVVENVVKAVFRRRRPFVPLVRAVVVGKRPGTWSFPSGHTASSFAGAWLLSLAWPRRAPLFFILASCVGLSRVYVGAHYPGDVLSGALLGISLAELFRRLGKRLLCRLSGSSSSVPSLAMPSPGRARRLQCGVENDSHGEQKG